MKALESVAAIGLLVAVGVAVFELCSPDAIARSILVYPLLPGYAAGFFVTQLGGSSRFALFSVWLVNSGLYWLLWNMLRWFFGKVRASARPSA
jgi:hypothetical protein